MPAPSLARPVRGQAWALGLSACSCTTPLQPPLCTTPTPALTPLLVLAEAPGVGGAGAEEGAVQAHIPRPLLLHPPQLLQAGGRHLADALQLHRGWRQSMAMSGRHSKGKRAKCRLCKLGKPTPGRRRTGGDIPAWPSRRKPGRHPPRSQGFSDQAPGAGRQAGMPPHPPGARTAGQATHQALRHRPLLPRVGIATQLGRVLGALAVQPRVDAPVLGLRHLLIKHAPGAPVRQLEAGGRGGPRRRARSEQRARS